VKFRPESTIQRIAEKATRSSREALTNSGNWPSLFVFVVLVALLLVPFVVQERVERLRGEIEAVAEPAQQQLSEIRVLLSLQSAELRGYLLTREDVYLDRYDSFVVRERQLLPELEEHAGELDPDLLANVVELRTLSDQWHERLAESELRDTSAVTGDLDELLEQELYQRIIESAGRTQLALRGTLVQRRQAIRDVERPAQLLYFLLVVLALGATLAVASLNARIKRLADEANARRSEVERALEDTARITAARTDLIRGFTHDVKNPLGAADGYAYLLEAGVRGELTATQLTTVTSIRRSIRGAIEIIEHLLDLSRLEGGGLTIRRERVDVQEMLEAALRHYAGPAQAAGIEVSMQLEPQADSRTVVYSDPERIKQILDNLVANALKYTPSGGRVLLSFGEAASGPAPKPGKWLGISVSDNGRGIPGEEIERIFDEFHRVPGSVGAGHGLGLAISRRVARLLGGEVTVRSVFGEGSTFTLWLPVREEAGPEGVDET
jgi:signal transduction histidine kinase